MGQRSCEFGERANRAGQRYKVLQLHRAGDRAAISSDEFNGKIGGGVELRPRVAALRIVALSGDAKIQGLERREVQGGSRIDLEKDVGIGSVPRKGRRSRRGSVLRAAGDRG